MKKEVLLHKLKMKHVKQDITALFFPYELRTFLEEHFQKYGEYLSLKDSWSYFNSVYPEILFANFSEKARKKEEPWMYFKENTSQQVMAVVLVDFIEHLNEQLVAQNKEKVPEEWFKLPLEVQAFDLLQLRHIDGFKTLYQSVIAHILREQLRPTEDIEKWYLKNVGSSWEVMSHPIQPKNTTKNKNPHFLSFNIAPKITAITEEEVVIEPHYSTTRYIFNPFTKDSFDYEYKWNPISKKTEKVYDKRSAFFLFTDYNPHSFVHFRLHRDKDGVDFYQKTLTMNRMNYLCSEEINAHDLMSCPSAYYPNQKRDYFAFVPYRPVDRNDAENLLEAGVSILEKKEFLDACLKALNAELFVETTVKNKMPTSIKEGKVFPEWTEKLKEDLLNQTFTISVYTQEEEKIRGLIEEAIKRFNPTEFKKNDVSSDFVFMKQEETEKQLLFYVYEKTDELCAFSKEELKMIERITDEKTDSIENESEKRKMRKMIKAEEKEQYKESLSGYCSEIFEGKAPLFSLSFSFKAWQEELFGPLDIQESVVKGRKKRKDCLVRAFPTKQTSNYHLIEIGKWKGTRKDEKTDPKYLIKEVLQQQGHITQMFHLETVSVDSIKNAIADLFVRKGFVNHFFNGYRKLFDAFTIYQPVAFSTNIQGDQTKIFSVSRLKDGVLSIKYKGTKWLTLEESILYLKKSRWGDLSKKDGFIAFYEGVIKDDEEANPLVLMDYLTYEQFDNMASYKKDYPLIKYDSSSERSPVASVFDKNGKISKGAALVLGSDEIYYSIAPKTVMDNKAKISDTKREKNHNFVNRVVCQFHVCHVDNENERDEIAEVFHLMRNLSLTFASFTNHPYTKHVFHFHEKLIKKQEKTS